MPRALATTRTLATARTLRAASRYRALILGDNPTAYWRCNGASGNFSDEVSGQTAAASGTPTYAQPTLINNNDGLCVQSAHNALFTGPAINFASKLFSMECWVKPTSVSAGTNRRIMGEFGATITKMQIETDTIAFYIGGSDAISGPAVLANSTNHVVCTWDGANMRLYVNGVLYGPHAYSGTAPTNSAFIFCGQTIPSVSNLDGYLQEVAVYPYALSQGQVQAHYAMGQAMVARSLAV